MKKTLEASFVRVFAIVAFTVFAIFLFAPALYAQGTGQVSGTIADPSGAVLANIPVTLHNTQTNTSRTVNTDAVGLYSFTNLQPGHYELTASPAGFKPYKSSLLVEVGGVYTINAKVQLANSTTVEVTTDTSVEVNTTTPEVSQVITSEQVSQLPSLTRNPYDFVELSGNVSAGDSSNGSATGYQNGPSTVRGVGFNLNGGRQSGTEVLLDGVENISVFTDQVAIRVPIDSVQEYRIVTNNFLPEYGRASGGVVSVATKSGTNSFHGTVWEFNRLSATTANTVTNAQTGVPKGKYTRNQFGAEVAGPIKKDKLFFEGTAEFLRVRSAANLIAAIPSPQLLAAAPTNVQNFFTTYAGPTSAKLLSQTTNLELGTATGGTGPYYPTLSGSTPVFNIVSFTAPGDDGGGAPENRYNIVGRVDYTLNDKTQAFFRFSDDHEIDQSGYSFSSPYSQYNVGESTIGQSYLLSVAHEFNAAFSTVSKLAFTRANLLNNTYNTALQNTPTLFIGENESDPYSGRSFQLPGFFDSTPATGGLPSGGPQNSIQYDQDVNFLKGRHSIQAGAQILYIQMNQYYGIYAQADEVLGSSLTQGLNNFLTGNLYESEVAVNPKGAVPCANNPYLTAANGGNDVLTVTPACTLTFPLSPPSFGRSDRYHDWAAYAQDQFKASDKLTLDYGVRYEYFGVQHNNNPNLDSNFYYGSGSSLFQQIRNGSVETAPKSPIGRLWNPQYGTVSPRIGFAYDVFGNGKTSFRAGYGISYERNFGNVTFNVLLNPPNYAVVANFTNAVVTTSNSIPGPTTGNTEGLPPSELRHVDQNIRTAQTQFTSASISQQLARNTVFEITFDNSRGVHLYDIKNYNIPGSGNLYLGDPLTVNGNTALTSLNSQFSNDNNRGSDGDSYYDALNFELNTRDIHHTGLSLVANYTYGHALDDLSTAFSEDSTHNLGYTNAFDPGLDHGSSDYDLRHRLVIAPIYKVPTLSGKPMLVREVLGGYEATGIYTTRTGTPFTYYDSTNDASGYQIPRYNPITPVRQTLFKNIPTGASNTGNFYSLTGANTLPLDNPFYNPALPDPSGGYPLGISDFGPYPSTMTGRNVFRGPGAYNFDCSLSKQFPIHESVNVELRAEGFNVTNHHNLYIQEGLTDANNYNPGNPQIFASKGGVGNNGGANDERRFLQFAGKINF